MYSFYLGLTMAVYLIGLVSTIFIGTPTHIVLNKLNIKNGIAYILMGFIAPVFICWITMFYSSDNALFFVGIISGFFGAVCAYVFWLYAVTEVKEQ